MAGDVGRGFAESLTGPETSNIGGLVRRGCGECLLASDPVAVTVEAINIIPNHSDWPPDILRTVTSAPRTINIAGVWNAA